MHGAAEGVVGRKVSTGERIYVRVGGSYFKWTLYPPRGIICERGRVKIDVFGRGSSNTRSSHLVSPKNRLLFCFIEESILLDIIYGGHLVCMRLVCIFL